jgi:hypothetical protein
VSSNLYQDHLIVVPEDRPYRKIAKGFEGAVPTRGARRIQVMPEAGGWLEAVKQVETDLHKLRRYPERRLVLLIDFDGDANRRLYVEDRIPQEVKDRVFLLGSFEEAEDLTPGLGHPESIGGQVGRACEASHDGPWGHELLRHNATELDRLSTFARSLLFGI